MLITVLGFILYVYPIYIQIRYKIKRFFLLKVPILSIYPPSSGVFTLICYQNPLDPLELLLAKTVPLPMVC